MRTKILEIGKPTISGNLYSEEVIIRALAAWNMVQEEKKNPHPDVLPIFHAPNLTPKEEDIIGFAWDIKIEDGYLNAEIAFIPERAKNYLVEGELINIRVNGIGTIINGVVQDDFRLNGFVVIHQKNEKDV